MNKDEAIQVFKGMRKFACSDRLRKLDEAIVFVDKYMKEKSDTAKATEEFFKHVVRVFPVKWDCAEMKYEGVNDRFPNLIKILKNE